MSEEELREIKERWDRLPRPCYEVDDEVEWKRFAAEETSKLLAEIDRLRAENEELRRHLAIVRSQRGL